MAGGTGLDKLAEEVPEQYYDVGIAEQDAVLFASGIALQGGKPVCAIYSTFLQRAFDQIVHDVCLQELNVVFAMDRAGLVGDDGPTHHGAFDISYFRPLPNVVLMAPRDEAMLVHMLRTALAYDDGPVAFRYPRGTAEGVPLPEPPREIPIGTGEVLQEGERVALLGYGWGVQVANDAAALAERARDHADRRRRPLRQAARRGADRTPRRRARSRRHDRGERPAGWLRRRRPRARRGRLRPRPRPDPPDRHPGPIRHARQAVAAARRGRPQRLDRRRARDGCARRARSPPEPEPRFLPTKRKRPYLTGRSRVQGGELCVLRGTGALERCGCRRRPACP